MAVRALWWLPLYVEWYRAGRWSLPRFAAEVALRLLPGRPWLRMELLKMRRIEVAEAGEGA